MLPRALAFSTVLGNFGNFILLNLWGSAQNQIISFVTFLSRWLPILRLKQIQSVGCNWAATPGVFIIGKRTMSQETKRTSLLFLVGALIAVVLLSGSLSNLALHAGTPFPGVDTHETAPQTSSEQFPAYSLPVLPGILGLILLLLIVYVLISLISFINLKWLLRWLFRAILALTGLFVFLLILSYLNLGQTGASEWMVEIAPASSSPIATSPLGRPPGAFVWSVALAFLLVAGFFLIRIFRQPARSSEADDRLLQQAKSAMQALRAGDDFRSVIIRCYLQMMNTLQEEQGIERSREMTTREFRDWLEYKGLPPRPVQKLTELFEKVRYGKEPLAENDEKIALDSLSEIVAFAERTKDAALAG
jgi:hypothetical protein